METTLEAIQRDTFGKNEARRLRREGKVPAVLYGGDSKGATPIAVEPRALLKILHSESGQNTLIALKLSGAGDARPVIKWPGPGPQGVRQAFPEKDLATFDLEDVSLAAFLHTLFTNGDGQHSPRELLGWPRWPDSYQPPAAVRRLDFVIHSGVKGQVTVKVSDMPWHELLENVLASNGLGFVLDDNLLAEGFRKGRRDGACRDVDVAARRPGNDDLYGADRKILGEGARGSRHRQDGNPSCDHCPCPAEQRTRFSHTGVDLLEYAGYPYCGSGGQSRLSDRRVPSCLQPKESKFSGNPGARVV